MNQLAVRQGDNLRVGWNHAVDGVGGLSAIGGNLELGSERSAKIPSSYSLSSFGLYTVTEVKGNTFDSICL